MCGSMRSVDTDRETRQSLSHRYRVVFHLRKRLLKKLNLNRRAHDLRAGRIFTDRDIDEKSVNLNGAGIRLRGLHSADIVKSDNVTRTTSQNERGAGNACTSFPPNGHSRQPRNFTCPRGLRASRPDVPLYPSRFRSLRSLRSWMPDRWRSRRWLRGSLCNPRSCAFCLR